MSVMAAVISQSLCTLHEAKTEELSGINQTRLDTSVMAAVISQSLCTRYEAKTEELSLTRPLIRLFPQIPTSATPVASSAVCPNVD